MMNIKKSKYKNLKVNMLSKMICNENNGNNGSFVT